MRTKCVDGGCECGGVWLEGMWIDGVQMEGMDGACVWMVWVEGVRNEGVDGGRRASRAPARARARVDRWPAAVSDESLEERGEEKG